MHKTEALMPCPHCLKGYSPGSFSLLGPSAFAVRVPGKKRWAWQECSFSEVATDLCKLNRKIVICRDLGGDGPERKYSDIYITREKDKKL